MLYDSLKIFQEELESLPPTRVLIDDVTSASPLRPAPPAICKRLARSCLAVICEYDLFPSRNFGNTPCLRFRVVPLTEVSYRDYSGVTFVVIFYEVRVKYVKIGS